MDFKNSRISLFGIGAVLSLLILFFQPCYIFSQDLVSHEINMSSESFDTLSITIVEGHVQEICLINPNEFTSISICDVGTGHVDIDENDTCAYVTGIGEGIDRICIAFCSSMIGRCDSLIVYFTILGKLECKEQVIIEANKDCIFMVSAQDLLVSNVSDIEGIEITIEDIIFIDSTLLNSSFLGHYSNFHVKDTFTGIGCWGSILFVDELIPYPNCSSDTISCLISTEPSSLGYPTPNDTNINIAILENNCYSVAGWDNCGDVELCYEDLVEDLNCHPIFCYRILRTWSVTDSNVLPNSPNMTSCVDTINILFPGRSSFQATTDFTQPNNQISCTDLNNNGILDCVEDLRPPFDGNGIPDINEDSLSGVAQANSPYVVAGVTKIGIPLPSVTGSPVGLECDDCVLSNWRDHIIEGPCDRYVERTWKIRGWCSNQDFDTTVVQRIEIIDDVGPIVTYCPGNYFLSLYTDLTSSSSLLVPEAYDDCDDLVYATGVERSAISDIGSIIQNEAGDYYLQFDSTEFDTTSIDSLDITITWTLEDKCGNVSHCFSEVTITVDITHNDSTISATEYSNIISTQVYPNPTSGELILEGEAVDRITVINSLGQVVKVFDLPERVISIEELQQGLYLFEIYGEGKKEVRTIFKW